MKKRLFINIHYLEIGGAERALLGLLSALDPDKVDIDLFVNQHTGEFMSLIPNSVNILPEVPEYTCIERPIKNIVKEGYIGMALRRMWAKYKHKQYLKTLITEERKHDSSIFLYVANAVEDALPSLEHLGEYDFAISFLEPHNIVLKKVKAKKKICWIHTDYSAIQVNVVQELKVWKQYDYIASISEEVTTAFLKSFPFLKDKIVLIENILSAAFVREQAILQNTVNEIEQEKGVIKLCSIGRFSYPKNFDNIPYICKKIVEQGVKVKWFIIGYGGDEELIKERIREHGMEKYVILLGKKENPYPYIKACDIYVQPSRYEGKAVTVREAQILCKPVVITDYPTAKSQVDNGVDGLIIPLDNDLAAKSIAKFVINKNMQQEFIEYMNTHDYGNENEVEKIYALIEK